MRETITAYLRQSIQLLSSSRRLLLIIWPFLLIVPLLVLLSLLSMDILSSVRAYVGGESLWSKAQKESIFHLNRYAESRAEHDYQEFLRTIAVPLGDAQARRELEKERPDLDVVREGFIAGRNHTADIPGLINLYRYFRHVSFIQRVIAIWAEGDDMIDELRTVAGQLHDHIAAGGRDVAHERALLAQIAAINERLTPLEDAFSYTLGEASRTAQWLLVYAVTGIALLLMIASTVMSRRMLIRTETMERALQLSQERYELALSGTNDGLWDWNIISDDIYWSPRALELLACCGRAPGATGKAFMQLLEAGDAEQFSAAISAHLRDGIVYDVEFRLPTRAGTAWFRARGRSVRDSRGVPVRMAGALTDITERKLAEKQLFAEKERAQVTLASIGDAVITTDVHGVVEYMNLVAEVVTGWSAAAARGVAFETVCRLVDERTHRPAQLPLQRALQEAGQVSEQTNLLLRSDGSELAIDTTASAIRDRDGGVIGVVFVLQDVSHHRQYAAQLSYQASHDALTGLINRREFERRLAHAIDHARGAERQHALLYLDLDQFKVVNDTCGHAAGDELLRQVTTLLRPCLRESDALARLGGDEFGVLLEDCPAEQALIIANKLQRAIADFQFAWDKRFFSVGVSIGLVNTSVGPLDLAEILSAADSACYLAKERGRNRVQVFSLEDGDLSVRHGQMEWVGRIQDALREDRFCLYAQSIVDLRGGDGGHCELLVRMLSSSGEVIAPMAFIPAAERYNLMPAIDRWVIKAAFDALAAAPVRSLDSVAINLSGASLSDDHFLDYIKAQFERTGIAPQSICFEITETAAIANLSKAAGFIGELNRLGCRFALDDFGVGMSSFVYLKHLPVDYLKIDGSFVKDMLEDPIDRAMVETINHIGHIMGKKTIAEGVESDAALAQLRLIGVDFAQGYRLQRPQPFVAGGAGVRSAASTE